VGAVMWVWLGCTGGESQLPSAADYALRELTLTGEARSDGSVVQAVLWMGSPDGLVQLGGSDELTLWMPDGQQVFTELADHSLLAQVASAELEGSIVLARGQESVELPVSLPEPFELTLEEPQSYGTPHRVSWEPSETATVTVLIEGMCLEIPLWRPLQFDQGWFEVQPADLPLAQDSCELWVKVMRDQHTEGLLTQQVRAISFVMGPVAGSTP
jgi:hypothetical protein